MADIYQLLAACTALKVNGPNNVEDAYDDDQRNGQIKLSLAQSSEAELMNPKGVWATVPRDVSILLQEITSSLEACTAAHKAGRQAAQDETAKTIGTLRVERDNARTAHQNCESRIQNLNEVIEEWDNSDAAKQNQIKDLESFKDVSSETIRELQEERADHRTTIQGLEKTCKTHESCEEKLRILEEAHESCEEKLRRLEEAHESCEEKLRTSEEAHKPCAGTIRYLRKTHEGCEEKLRMSEEVHKGCDETLRKSKKAHEGCGETLRKSEEAHKGCDETLRKSKKAHEGCGETLRKSEEAHKGCDETLRKSKKAHEGCGETIRKLRVECKSHEKFEGPLKDLEAKVAKIPGSKHGATQTTSRPNPKKSRSGTISTTNTASKQNINVKDMSGSYQGRIPAGAIPSVPAGAIPSVPAELDIRTPSQRLGKLIATPDSFAPNLTLKSLESNLDKVESDLQHTCKLMGTIMKGFKRDDKALAAYSRLSDIMSTWNSNNIKHAVNDNPDVGNLIHFMREALISYDILFEYIRSLLKSFDYASQNRVAVQQAVTNLVNDRNRWKNDCMSTLRKATEERSAAATHASQLESHVKLRDEVIAELRGLIDAIGWPE